jgi:hypothetical protein
MRSKWCGLRPQEFVDEPSAPQGSGVNKEVLLHHFDDGSRVRIHINRFALRLRLAHNFFKVFDKFPQQFGCIYFFIIRKITPKISAGSSVDLFSSAKIVSLQMNECYCALNQPFVKVFDFAFGFDPQVFQNFMRIKKTFVVE